MGSLGAPRKNPTGLALFFWCLLALLLLAPLFFLAKSGIQPPEDLDSRLAFEAIWQTFVLAVGVLGLSGLLGFGAAWSLHHGGLWGQSVLEKLIFAPLVFPTYVMAFVYLGALEPTDYSPQGQLWGLILVMSLSLFPYVYIFVRLGLAHVYQQDLEAHLALGRGRAHFFSSIVLKKVLPFVISALTLVLFETLADFGAASVMNVTVVTTLIYKLWFGYFSFSQAMGVAAYYLLFLVGLLVLESFWRKEVNALKTAASHRSPLSAQWALFASLGLWVIVALGFLFPVFKVGSWAMESVGRWDWISAFYGFLRSLLLAGVSGGMILILGLTLGGLLRHSRQKMSSWLALTSLGYSLPGVIVAVALVGLSRQVFPGGGFYTALGLLCFAMIYKFFPVAFRGVTGSFQKIPLSLDEYHQLTGKPWTQLWRYGFLPPLTPAILGSLVLVTIEVLKEMPLTLMMAPSQYQTLSIQIFNFTSEGEWEKASVSALFLILGGLSATVLIYRKNKEFVGEPNTNRQSAI